MCTFPRSTTAVATIRRAPGSEPSWHRHKRRKRTRSRGLLRTFLETGIGDKPRIISAIRTLSAHHSASTLPAAAISRLQQEPAMAVRETGAIGEAWVTILSALWRKGGLSSPKLRLSRNASSLEGRLESYPIVEDRAAAVAQAQTPPIATRWAWWQRTVQRVTARGKRQGQGKGSWQDQGAACHCTGCQGIAGTASCSSACGSLNRRFELRCPECDTEQARRVDLRPQDGGAIAARSGLYSGRAGQRSHAGPRKGYTSSRVTEGQRCARAQSSPQLPQGLFIFVGQLFTSALHHGRTAVCPAEGHLGPFRQLRAEMERAVGLGFDQPCTLDGQCSEGRLGLRPGAGCQDGCRQERRRQGSLEGSLELCRAGQTTEPAAGTARTGTTQSPGGCRSDSSCSAARCFTHAEAQGQGRGLQDGRGGPWQGPDLSQKIREGPDGLLESWQHHVTTMDDFVNAFYACTRAIMLAADVHWQLDGAQPRPLLPDPRIDDDEIDEIENEITTSDAESLQALLRADGVGPSRWPSLSVSNDPGRPDNIAGAWPHGQFGPVEPHWMSGLPADELAQAGEDLHCRYESTVHRGWLCTDSCLKGLAPKNKVSRSVRFGFAVSFWFPGWQQLCLPPRQCCLNSVTAAAPCQPASAVSISSAYAMPAELAQSPYNCSLEGCFPRSSHLHSSGSLIAQPLDDSLSGQRSSFVGFDSPSADMSFQGGSCRSLVTCPLHQRPPTPPIPSGRWDRSFGGHHTGSIFDLDKSEDGSSAVPARSNEVTVGLSTASSFDDTTFAVFDVIFHARVLRCREGAPYSELAEIAFEQSPLLGHPRNYRVVQHNLPGFPNRQVVIWGRKPRNSNIFPIQVGSLAGQVCTVEAPRYVSVMQALEIAGRHCNLEGSVLARASASTLQLYVNGISVPPFEPSTCETADTAMLLPNTAFPPITGPLAAVPTLPPWTVAPPFLASAFWGIAKRPRTGTCCTVAASYRGQPCSSCGS